MAASSASSSEPQSITSDFLDGAAPQPELGVIILNWKLPSITPYLLRKAAFFICADGGANRLHDEVPLMFTNQPPDTIRQQFLPHLIKGDLDSIRPDVTTYYEQAGVPIIDLSADQDSTDLQKCLNYVREHKTAQPTNLNISPTTTENQEFVPIQTIVVLGAHGGRLDHILANLSTLHQYRDMDIVLCGDGNLTRLVRKGRSVIRPYKALEGPSCGLIPLQGKVTATSSGLKWNLEDMQMVMGGLVSACNVIEGEEVTVETTGDLIWTTQLREVEIS